MCKDWTDQRIELYLQNRLPAKDNEAFEGHLLRCRSCQDSIEDEMNSLLALRRAGEAQRMTMAFGF